MTKKIVLLIALVSVLALLVPATSSAKGLCRHVRSGNLNIQVGYCP